MLVSQHPYQAAHMGLSLPAQGIHILMAYMNVYMHTYIYLILKDLKCV